MSDLAPAAAAVGAPANVVPVANAAPVAASPIPRIKGTTILIQKGGLPMRVVTATGLQFAPHDVAGVQTHLESLATPDAPKPTQQVKIKGTHIMIQKGGIAVRIVTATGNTFAPDDIAAVQAELETWAKANPGAAPVVLQPQPPAEGESCEDGAKKKKKKKKSTTEVSERKERKEVSPEEIQARKEKQDERFKAKVDREERNIIDDMMHTGEVVARGSFSAVWIRPLVPGDIPGEVQVKLEDMNSELREKAKEHKRKFAGGTEHNVIYADLHDVVEEGLIFRPGLQVKFKLYTDNKGVGACNVVSM